jgi:hypothetical protein
VSNSSRRFVPGPLTNFCLKAFGAKFRHGESNHCRIIHGILLVVAPLALQLFRHQFNPKTKLGIYEMCKAFDTVVVRVVHFRAGCFAAGRLQIRQGAVLWQHDR